MFRGRKFLLNWLPVLIWMVVIFSASSDGRSFEHSSRIVEPIIRWLFPHASNEAVRAWVIVARKCAHLSEYAILALLVWRALSASANQTAGEWSWKTAGLALLIVAAYAASDELHQAFVPTREASVRDVLIDTCGGLLGLLFLWRVKCWQKS